jgi:hypothetical protein
MTLTYNTYVTQLANLMVVDSANAEFTIFLPGCIDYAEQRIYRELDLLNTFETVATSSTAASTREYPLPDTFITVENINILTPSGSTVSNGKRNPLMPVSMSVLDLLWPTANSNTGVPQLFAMKNSTTIVFGPSPDSVYLVEVRGVVRPTPMSSGNQTTFLTEYCPDLLIAASMVFASGYMRNFGSQADDPKMSQSWESQYQTLFKSAELEQLRAKFQSQSWYSQKPTPANPPRS